MLARACHWWSLLPPPPTEVSVERAFPLSRRHCSGGESPGLFPGYGEGHRDVTIQCELRLLLFPVPAPPLPLDLAPLPLDFFKDQAPVTCLLSKQAAPGVPPVPEPTEAWFPLPLLSPWPSPSFSSF